MLDLNHPNSRRISIMNKNLFGFCHRRWSIIRHFTSARFDTDVGLFRQENRLILTLPSALISPKSNATLPSIAPFILHPPLSHKISTWDVQSLSNSEIIDSIIKIIERQYELRDRSDQFVGSMGENDGGVWFVAKGRKYDALDHWDIIQGNFISIDILFLSHFLLLTVHEDITRGVKDNRHGIPFGIYTCGRSISGDESEKALLLESDLGLSGIDVTLGAGEPSLYMTLIGCNSSDSETVQREFSRTCNFIAAVAESGIPLSASVASGKDASSGVALGRALGASDVIVRDLSHSDYQF
jgi:hypothetical protein